MSTKVILPQNAIRAALESTGVLEQDDLYIGKDGVTRDPSDGYVKGSAESLEERAERILVLVKNQDEY